MYLKKILNLFDFSFFCIFIKCNNKVNAIKYERKKFNYKNQF